MNTSNNAPEKLSRSPGQRQAALSSGASRFRSLVIFVILGAVAGAVAAIAVTTKMQAVNTTITVRPQDPQQFAEMALILTDAGTNWQSAQLPDRAFEIFLNKLNSRARRLELLNGESPTNGGSDAMKAVADSITTTPPGIMRDKSVTVYLPRMAGPELSAAMDRFVAKTISATQEQLKADGRAALEVFVRAKTRELQRVREQRELVIKQDILLHEKALRTATEAGIANELPTIARPPLFAFGPAVLRSEIANLQSLSGVDIAIPEYPAIGAAIGDLRSKQSALADLDITPVSIVKSATETNRISQMTQILAAALFAALGGALGYLCWRLSHRKDTKFAEPGDGLDAMS